MAKSASNLEQALIELIDGYIELESTANKAYGDDEDSFSNSVIEGLETSLDSAIEESNISTAQFATLLANLSEALEQIDPSAFEEDVFDEEEDNGMESLSDLEDYDEDEDYH